MQKQLLTVFLLLVTLALSAQEPFIRLTGSGAPFNQTRMNGNYRGCAFIDFDQDDDLDLCVMGAGIFTNDGNGAFEGPYERSLFTGTFGSVSWADYEADGDLDCLLGGSTTVVLKNIGASLATTDPDPNRDNATWSASWGEWNGDAYPEIICAVADGFGLSTPGFFFVGNADGTFSSLDTFSFTQNRAPYTVAYWSDFDNDADQDLFIASGPSNRPDLDYCYRNLLKETGQPGWERLGNEFLFSAQQQDGQCYNFIDADLDGDRDLYLTNWVSAPTRYYINNDGEYQETNNAITNSSATFLANAWGDIDNDGDEDVIITAGSFSNGSAGVYRNEGNHQFRKIYSPFVNASAGASGITLGDVDADGDLDFFTLGAGQTSSTSFRGLFVNQHSNNSKHWLQIDLEGVPPSNRAALGARVYVKAEIQGQQRWLQREVSAMNTFMGHNALRLHFGLDESTSADSIRIIWPSGAEDIYTDVEADQIIRYVEQISNKVHGQIHVIETRIAPNPTIGIARCDLPAIVVNAQMFDGKGRKINASFRIQNNSLIVDASSLPPGKYYLIVETEEGEMYRAELVRS